MIQPMLPISAAQEADRRVQGCIAAREKYLARLRELLTALLPSSLLSPSKSDSKKTTGKQTDSNNAVMTRKTISDRLRMRTRLPPSKEMHVLGDALLLLRASSVNVVESVSNWRQVVHGGQPVAYSTPQTPNYLLHMSQDGDFLDQCPDLVDWLGFRLRRNPFILRDGLDAGITTASPSSSPMREPHERPSSSTITALPPPVKERRRGRGSAIVNGKHEADTIAVRAPLLPALVRPLISILPDGDDAMDGARVTTAQSVVRDEEAIHGQLNLHHAVTAFLARTQPGDTTDITLEEEKTLTMAERVCDKEGEDENGWDVESSSGLYHAIAEQFARLSQCENRVAQHTRALSRATSLTEQVQQQIQRTMLHRERGNPSPSHQDSEPYRQETLCLAMEWGQALQECILTLTALKTRWQNATDKHKQKLHNLEKLKTRARQARQDKKLQQEAIEVARRKQLRQKTLEREQLFRVKRPRKREPNSIASPKSSNQVKTNTRHQPGNSEDCEADCRASYPRDDAPPESMVERQHRELEAKRRINLEKKEQRKQEECRALRAHQLEMEHKRNERAQMFLEDVSSTANERRRRQYAFLKAQHVRCLRAASVLLFSSIQPIQSGCEHSENRQGHLRLGTATRSVAKKWRIAVYEHLAAGYTLDGVRVVAYDPVTSASLTFVLSTREYHSLGYGRTKEGLASFCQQLCVIYEARKRRHRLIWTGSPCPPPLRVREYDHALVCVHKEGVRTARSRPESLMMRGRYHLVAVYLRMNDCSRVQFVVASMESKLARDADAGLAIAEYTVAASRLVQVSSMALGLPRGDDSNDGDGQHQDVVWLHNSSQGDEMDGKVTEEPLRVVYEGEAMTGALRVHIVVCDASCTEYRIALAPISSPQRGSRQQRRHEVVLLKRDVNPYTVQLPARAFRDLVSCLHITEGPPIHSGDNSDGGVGKPPANNFLDEVESQNYHVELPASVWRERLVKYVRVVRMARFGARIDGVFHFITMMLVQQKTEYRAHLLLEITRVSTTVMTRPQSLRMDLADFLRCPDAAWRLFSNRTSAAGAVHSDAQCEVCYTHRQQLENAVAVRQAKLAAQAAHDTDACSRSCRAVQETRVACIQRLIAAAHGSIPATVSDALEYIYNAACPDCGALPPPLIILVNHPSTATTASTARDLGYSEHIQTPADDVELTVLNHYFACYPTAQLEDEKVCEATRCELESRRVIVLSHAPLGMTVASATTYIEALHWQLFPAQDELPVHLALVVDTGVPSLQKLQKEGLFCEEQANSTMLDAPHDVQLRTALHELAASITYIALVPPVSTHNPDEYECALNFDMYLISEALLVEVIRVLLQPALDWRLPSETVGASSWNTAREFMLNPAQLSAKLQIGELMAATSTTAEILAAYTSHPKWPRLQSDVRPGLFAALWACVAHICHVRNLVELQGGWLDGASANMQSQSHENTSDCKNEDTAPAQSCQLPINISIIKREVREILYEKDSVSDDQAAKEDINRCQKKSSAYQ